MIVLCWQLYVSGNLEFDNSGSAEKIGLGMRPINTVISCDGCAAMSFLPAEIDAFNRVDKHVPWAPMRRVSRVGVRSVRAVNRRGRRNAGPKALRF